MKTIFFSRVEIQHDGELKDVHVVYCPRKDLNLSEFSSVIKDDVDQNLQPDDILIICRKNEIGYLSTEIKSSSVIDANLRRLRQKTRISFIAFNSEGKQCDNIRFSEDIEPSGISLSDIQRPCLTDIFRRYNGFVEATPGFHFKNPSKKHTNRFIRLGNILYESTEISFISIALLGFVQETVSHVYIDTTSLFCVVSALNEHFTKFGLYDRIVQTTNFRSYRGVLDSELRSADDTIYLISASTSGNLADLIVSKQGVRRENIFHLLYLGIEADKQRIACNLAFDLDYNLVGYRDFPADYRGGACRLCDEGSTCIEIFGDQFDLPPPQLDSLSLLREDASRELKSFVGKFAGNEIFGVGLGRREDPVPRLYNINVANLLTNESFAKDLRYVMRRSVPLSTKYVVYLDKRSQPLAEMVVNCFTDNMVQPIKVGRDDLHLIPDDNDSPVVVVAAVIESGRSLLDISRDLRRSCRNAPIVYLVGVDKSSGAKKRRSIKSNLDTTIGPVRHDVVFIESIILPVSAEFHAWDAERKLWQNEFPSAQSDPEFSDVARRRITRLDNFNDALVGELFLDNRFENNISLQPGFVFADDGSVDRYTQADVFFTISSILQRLRAESENGGLNRAIRSNWFQQTLVAPSNFSRYNEGVIQASFLRAAFPSELNYAASEGDSRDMTRIIRRVLKSASRARGESSAEFLIALATRRMSLIDADLKSVLESVPPDQPFLQLLRSICQRRETAGGTN